MKTTIGHFVDSDVFGGAEVVVLDLCVELKSNSYRPVICIFKNPELESRAAQAGIEILRVPNYHRFKSIYSLPIFTCSFSSFLKKHHISLLHSHLFGAITGASAACRIAGVPHVGTLHDVYMVEERRSLGLLLKLSHLLGTNFVVVSNAMKEFYSSILPDPSLILNGVPCVEESSSSEDIREKLGVSQQDLVIVNVGRLVPLKRQRDLIQAFLKLGSQRSVKLFLCGDGPERKFLQREIDELGLGESVSLMGFRRDVADVLRVSDIYVQCSETEGLSRSILEALSVGLPVVASNVGGNIELVRDGINGFLFSTGDVESLVEKVSLLLGDSLKRRIFGEKSQELFKNYFTLEKMVDGYLGLYEKLLFE